MFSWRQIHSAPPLERQLKCSLRVKNEQVFLKLKKPKAIIIFTRVSYNVLFTSVVTYDFQSFKSNLQEDLINFYKWNPRRVLMCSRYFLHFERIYFNGFKHISNVIKIKKLRCIHDMEILKMVRDTNLVKWEKVMLLIK